MKQIYIVLALALSFCLLAGIGNATLPQDWQTNPQVMKIAISAYSPEILIIAWFDNDVSHYQAQIGVPIAGQLATTIPIFTADNLGYFFRGSVSQEGGAGEAYPGTPIIH